MVEFIFRKDKGRTLSCGMKVKTCDYRGNITAVLNETTKVSILRYGVNKPSRFRRRGIIHNDNSYAIVAHSDRSSQVDKTLSDQNYYSSVFFDVMRDPLFVLSRIF